MHTSTNNGSSNSEEGGLERKELVLEDEGELIVWNGPTGIWIRLGPI